MKILLVCKTLPHTFKGGIQTHTWKLAGRLTARGHHVSVLTSGSWRKPLIRREKEAIELIELPYMPLRYLPGLFAVADEWAFNVAAKKWLLNNQDSYDIIHLQGRSGNLFLKEKSQVRKPVVATLHGFVEQECSRFGMVSTQSLDQRLHYKLGKMLENCAMHNADTLLPVSQFALKCAVDRVPDIEEKCLVVHNGIDIMPAPRNPDYSSKELLFVGRIAQIKGIFELVEAMKKVNPFVRLTIIGDGPEFSAIKKKIADARMQDRIRLMGSQPEEVVFEQIDRARALILPSFHETHGIVLMEANVRCKPVLASDIPGARTSVTHGENGLMFPAGDIQAMTTAINYLFSDEKLARQLGMNGRARIERDFSWEKMAEETEAAYNELLQKSPAKTNHHALSFAQ